ncbi:uncharacterized protein [Oscarella lobularis]|uniref:uncharacterized protein isoform X2 n=1 Tax=Oscarella lobularis TaxID=121494 RepID=UPI0033137C76
MAMGPRSESFDDISRLSGKAPGRGERSGSVLIRNKDGSAPRDVPVLRIFLPDETYRALKPSPEMTCGDVIETLWPRLHLGGRRDDYGLYVIYTLADARFVRDDEKVDTLNGNPWDRIVKIYLRYRDDSSVPEEGTDGNVCIPRDRLNTFGRLRSNPFAATTGDLSKVHQRRESTANPLQRTFRNAWKLGTQLSEDEPPLLFDDPDDIFQRHDNFDAGHLGNGVAVSLSDRSPIESGYGTLRSMMYSNLGTLGRKSEAGEEEEEKFQFYPENVSQKTALTDEEMSLSSFSTFRTVSDGAMTLKRNKSSLNEQLEIAETFFFTVENNENDPFEFPPPPPPIVSLSRDSSPLPPPPPVKQKPHGRNSISSVDILPPPPSPLSLRNSSIVAGFGSRESFPPPPSPLGLLSPREASPCGWPAPPSPLYCPVFDDDMLPLPSPPPALESLQPSDTYFPPPPESLQIFSDIPPPPPPPPLKS